MSRIALIYNDWQGPLIAGLLQNGGFTPVCLDKRRKNETAGESLPPSAIPVTSISQAIKGVVAVLTFLDSQQMDEDIYMASRGIFAAAKPGGLFIDLSTVTPRMARELSALAAVHDHSYVEAPLLGTRQELVDGQAEALIGGEADGIQRALPILGALAGRVTTVGLPGSGMAAKLAWQVSLAGSLVGLVEAIAFATASGLEKEEVMNLLVGANNPANSMARVFGQAIVKEDFSAGQDVKGFLNDLGVALEAADEADLPLPGLETVQQLFDLLQLVGDDRRGIQSLALAYYDEKNSQRFGLDWSLAQKAMDVYERGTDTMLEDYLYDYDEGEDYPPHLHDHQDEPPGFDPYGSGEDSSKPSIGRFFSNN